MLASLSGSMGIPARRNSVRQECPAWISEFDHALRDTRNAGFARAEIPWCQCHPTYWQLKREPPVVEFANLSRSDVNPLPVSGSFIGTATVLGGDSFLIRLCQGQLIHPLSSRSRINRIHASLTQ